jgi:hypothetical protein
MNSRPLHRFHAPVFRRITLAVAILAAPLSAACADDDAPTRRLTLSPAAEPQPALKYRLLPGPLELRPGNAAVLYNKTAIGYPPTDHGSTADRMDQWLRLPLGEFPTDEARAVVNKWREVIDELHLAARRERCDWELPIRERSFLSLPLPEVSAAGSFVRLLAVEARLQIAERRFDDALHTLQTGFAIARHLAQAPVLVNTIIAWSAIDKLNRLVLDWASQPGSPNLYWALTALPRPLADPRQAIDSERESLYFSLPELRELESTTHTAEHWQGVLDRLLAFFAEARDVRDNWEERLPLALLAVKQLPRAKESLVERGHSADAVAKMPVAQVLLLDVMHAYDIERDRVYKQIYLPYAEVAENQFGETDPPAAEQLVIPLAMVLLPAIDAYHFHLAHYERKLAMLRTIEALRNYGALHDGKLPPRLEDARGLPIPRDPMTGRSFIYRHNNETAMLATPPPQREREAEAQDRFEIRFAK